MSARPQPSRHDGFTLLELLVVIVILAILLAIAVPAYLSQQKKAHDSKAKIYLNLAFRTAKADAVGNNNKFLSAPSMIAQIAQDQPVLNVISGSAASATTGQIVVDPASTAATMIAYAHSGSGDNWKQICNINTGCLPTVNLGQAVAALFTVGSATRLTTGAISGTVPSLSADGNTILFSGSGTLYTMPATGGALTSRGFSGFAYFVPGSSTRIVCDCSGREQAQNLDGTGAVTLVASSAGVGTSSLPISPDGSLFAYSVGGALWVAPVAGGAATKIVAANTDSNYGWVDNTHLIYHNPSTKSLINISSTGTGATTVVSGLIDGYSWIATSPDGTKVAYADNGALWVKNSDGSGSATKLADSTKTSGEATNSNNFLAWSPDGSSIIFTTGGYPTQNCWVIRSDGQGATKFASGADPMIFYPDSKTVIYSDNTTADYFKVTVK